MTNTNTMKTFKSIAWNGKRGEFTCVPFRKAESNPNPEIFAPCEESELGNASRIRIEGSVEVWGWL